MKYKNNNKTWLITGVAGFIGSNILEELLKNDQNVIGLDNFSTGRKLNLDRVRLVVGNDKWKNFDLIHGDITDYSICESATKGVDFILHNAALGSVSRSISDPISSNNSNVSGFLNMLYAAKENNITKFVYASSSSVYGDHLALPKIEKNTGNALSPYALTKVINEKYSHIFSSLYDMDIVGLRYFNVFGKYQNPESQYAAVIPKWINSVINNDPVYIYGDGLTSRDFCFITNVVQANILSALKATSGSHVFNIACSGRTSLNALLEIIIHSAARHDISYSLAPIYSDFRKGDVRHSEADISCANKILGYKPTHNINEGINELIDWVIKNNNKF